MARPFAFHKTISAPRSNTTPVRPLGVKIVNLGWPAGSITKPGPLNVGKERFLAPTGSGLGMTKM